MGQRPRVVLLRSVLAALGLMLVACAATGDPQAVSTDQGPVATIRSYDSDLQMLARGAGTLEITDRCVILNEGEHDFTLAWPSRRTSWDAEARQILFDDPRRGEVELADGARVELGGGWPYGPPGDGFEPDWVNAPAETCPPPGMAVQEVQILR